MMTSHVPMSTFFVCTQNLLVGNNVIPYYKIGPTEVPIAEMRLCLSLCLSTKNSKNFVYNNTFFIKNTSHKIALTSHETSTAIHVSFATLTLLAGCGWQNADLSTELFYLVFLLHFPTSNASVNEEFRSWLSFDPSYWPLRQNTRLRRSLPILNSLGPCHLSTILRSRSPRRPVSFTCPVANAAHLYQLHHWRCGSTPHSSVLERLIVWWEFAQEKTDEPITYTRWGHLCCANLSTNLVFRFITPSEPFCLPDGRYILETKRRSNTFQDLDHKAVLFAHFLVRVMARTMPFKEWEVSISNCGEDWRRLQNNWICSARQCGCTRWLCTCSHQRKWEP